MAAEPGSRCLTPPALSAPANPTGETHAYLHPDGRPAGAASAPRPGRVRRRRRGRQSYALDFELKYQTDRRTRGVSDTKRCRCRIHRDGGTRSGALALLQIGASAKRCFPTATASILGALGYRNGTATGWRYGVGLAQEWFPGASADAPTGVDWMTTAMTGEPTFTGMANTSFDTRYLLLELGYGMLDARYLYVLSQDFRGNNNGHAVRQHLLPWR